MKHRIMRSKPPKEEVSLHRWYTHVERVSKDLAARPSRRRRLGRWLGWSALGEAGHVLRLILELPSRRDRAATPERTYDPLPEPPGCAHEAAETVRLGDLMRRPKRGDAAVAGIVARRCPTCGLTTAVLR